MKSFKSYSIKIQLSILILSCFFQYKIFAAEDIPLEDQNIYNAIVKLADRPENEQIQGTGFFLENHLVTNFHVINAFLRSNDLDDIFLLSKEGALIPIKIKRVVALSALYDIALLETADIEKSYLSLRENPLDVTEDLFILAYPNGNFQQLEKQGKIQFLGNENYGFYINYFESKDGISGAPVLDNKQQVLGIHDASVVSFLSFTNGKA